MTRAGSSPIPELMAGNHSRIGRHKFKFERKKNMLNHFLNARTLRTMVLAVTAGMLPAMIAVPVGAADKPLSKSELKSLIATAETKAEHERIAKYFNAEAARYEAEAAEHGQLAQVYRKSGLGSPKSRLDANF
jgi:hypothetical protein